jgi:hypothetical protein
MDGHAVSPAHQELLSWHWHSASAARRDPGFHAVFTPAAIIFTGSIRL